MGNTFGANYWDGLAGIAMILKGGFGVWGGSLFSFYFFINFRAKEKDLNKVNDYQKTQYKTN